MISLTTAYKNLNNGVNFKSSMNIKEKNAIDNKLLKDSYKEQQKIEVAAAAIGLGTGAICKLANKTKPIDKGIGAYFASLIAMLTLHSIKEINKKVDLGSEEKNKQYEEAKKQERKDHLKYSLIPSLLVGAVSAAITGIVCASRKIPDKFDKITTAALVTTTPVLLISNLILGNKMNNEQRK